jgi:hypothetical protein
VTLNLSLWLIVIGAALMLEGASFLSQRDKWLPLTYYIKRFVPKVIIAAALLWLAHHFGV